MLLPEFSCGLDKLNYSYLLKYIFQVFGNTDMTIQMFHVPQPKNINRIRLVEQDADCRHCKVTKMENFKEIPATMGNVLAHWTSIIKVDGVEPPQMREDQLYDKDIGPIMRQLKRANAQNSMRSVGIATKLEVSGTNLTH